MNTSETSIPLAALDSPAVVELHPQIWRANLAALEQVAPELFQRLNQVRLPESWRPVRGLDGFLTWRVEPGGATPQWLDGTAAPGIRAAGLLSTYQPSARNPALARLGTGGELTWLLDRLPRWLAVYVFEPDPPVLAAVLRQHDFAWAIRAHRCIFVPPAAEQPFLRQLLQQHPGLLSPGDILLPDRMPRERLDALRALCEDVMRAAEQDRSHALAALQRLTPPHPAKLAAGGDAPSRIAVLSLHDRPHARSAAAALTRAARALGLTCTHCDLAGPLDAHILPHVAALAELAPELTLCVDAVPPGLPRELRGLTALWCTDDPPSVPADADLLLAASPMIEKSLRARVGDGMRVEPCYWAAENTPRGPDRAAVVLVADLPPADPEAFDISLSSHQVLWKAARQVCLAAWDASASFTADDVLRRAERECGLTLEPGQTRDAFLDRIARVIAPATTCERIAEIILQRPEPASVFGTGWQRLADPRVKSLAGNLEQLTGARAMIFAGHPDPLHPHLLAAAAAGCPILLHQPGGATDVGGGVLRAHEHFAPFGSASELRSLLADLARDPQPFRERADRARAHVLAHHTYAVRWTALLDGLRRH